MNRLDAEFRPRIIRAYEHRCAATSWDLRIGHTDAGLEAAHIKWHTVGGPSVETNGIALNSLHHKLFDLGAFTLSLYDPIPHILVSREVHGGDAARELLIGLHGKAMRPPQDLAGCQTEHLSSGTNKKFSKVSRGRSGETGDERRRRHQLSRPRDGEESGASEGNELRRR